MKTLLITVFCAGSLFAGEVLKSLDIDDQHYESVKWGAVNQGKIVIFHSRGVAIIPLEKLPAEYQAQFGYKPDPAPPALTPAPPVAPPAPWWCTGHRCSPRRSCCPWSRR